MLLNVAVKQRKPRLIGDHIHGNAAKHRDNHGIFHDSGRRFAIDIHQFKEVPVDVQWVGIVGAIAENDPVPRAFLQHKFLLVRIFLAVYQSSD